MEKLKQNFRHLLAKAEHAFDSTRFYLKQKLHLLDPITIQSYPGYGNQEHIIIKGRVLENKGLQMPSKNASYWENLKILYHRYESDEISGAKVCFRFAGKEGSLTTDHEGYFQATIPNEQGLKGWQTIEYTLLEPYAKDQAPVQISEDVLLQSPNSSFGLISDLDDTVIVSKTTNFLKKIRLLLFNNERSRKPFEGVSAFYSALERGKNGIQANPVFYLSSSSWNLYDMFSHFCQLNHLPKGVFLLRDVGLDKKKFYRTGHNTHKLENISAVLETFRSLPFLLIGDSGQQDPEIYQTVVQQNPGRIIGIYIRDVHPKANQKRDLHVNAIAQQVSDAGVPMKLVRDSYEAALDAAQRGWISTSRLEQIRQETLEEKQKKPSLN